MGEGEGGRWMCGGVGVRVLVCVCVWVCGYVDVGGAGLLRCGWWV